MNTLLKLIQVFLSIILCSLSASAQIDAKTFAQIIPLPQAHAHNDYEHEQPLWDALRQGFTSIEIDVFPIDGELYVAHNLPNNPQSLPNLRQLYLDPLRSHINQHGSIYPNYTATFYLMIDIKREGEKAYKILHEQLEAYTSMLSSFGGPVSIFLSGDRPITLGMGDTSRWVSFDGRPDDLDKNYPSEFMPVISQRYGKIVSWRGKGKMPSKQAKLIRELCKQAEKQGKKVRLWASPEKEVVWKQLLKLGVDYINTDKLEELATFFKQNKVKSDL